MLRPIDLGWLSSAWYWVADSLDVVADADELCFLRRRVALGFEVVFSKLGFVWSAFKVVEVLGKSCSSKLSMKAWKPEFELRGKLARGLAILYRLESAI